MSEEFKDGNPPVPPPAEPDVAALIKKIQQQLTFLEKKIDILISQSQAAPAREKSFSKPYRPFGRFHRQERDPAQGRNFEKRPREENRGYGPKKKAYDNPRGSDSGHERHFERSHGGENRGFEQKKKPFYYGRKSRG